jgi:diguanylate cyclase (GGDEF)-like protein/PAS domain S-box-containing protein
LPALSRQHIAESLSGQDSVRSPGGPRLASSGKTRIISRRTAPLASRRNGRTSDCATYVRNFGGRSTINPNATVPKSLDSRNARTIVTTFFDQHVSETWFRAVFENDDALPIQGYAPDGTVRYWNPASSRLYGYSREEALGNSLYALIIPPEAREHVVKDVHFMFAHRQGIPPARLVLRRKDGSAVVVFSSHAVVETPEHGMLLFCLDIDLTELVQTEQELRETEQLYRALFDGSGDGIVLLKDGLVVDCNVSLGRLFGCDRAWLLGRTLLQLSPARQPHGESSAERLPLLLEEVTAGSDRVFEWLHQRPDGSRFEAEIHLAPIEIARQRHVIGTVRDVSERKRAEAYVQHLAHHDALTGLPNRTLLSHRFALARAIADRTRDSFALLYLDLDHFRVLNDTLGRAVGDTMLKYVAERLRPCIDESGTICRLGGDEFILLVRDARPQAIERIATRILARLAQPVLHAEHELCITGSLGIAFYPLDGDCLDTLLQRADMAVYAAKASGRNKAHFYSPEMQAAIDRRVSLASRLQRALRNHELCLHYQPQVDDTGRVVGAEALLRWPTPGEAPVQPLDIIALAEETGTIVSIGRFVLEQACNTLVEWSHHPVLRTLSLAINVSARQFREHDFETLVADVLRETGCNASRLRLELTESVVLDNVEDAIKRMQRLQRLNLGLSLDDFGSGYSSLSYLKRLPLNQLKIDRSFVQHIGHDPRDEAIVAAILAMCRVMGLDVVAEGIETVSQRERLTQLGCRGFQGNYYAEPMEKEALVALLQDDGARLPI